MVNGTAWAAKQQASAAFLSTVEPIANQSLAIGWPVIQVFDLWECDKAHNYLTLNYPSVTPAMYQGMHDLAQWYWNRSTTWSFTIRRQMAGKMIGQLLAAIDAVVAYNASSGAPPPLRFLHFSAHDTTVMPLLVALEVFDGEPPRYAANVVLELRRPSAGGDYFVRVAYNDVPLVLPFCNGATDCPYASAFRAHLLPFAVFSDDEYAAICTPTSPPPTPQPPTNDAPLVIAVAALTTLSAVLGVSLYMSRRKLASALAGDVEASSAAVEGGYGAISHS